jgi:hypothetical protein
MEKEFEDTIGVIRIYNGKIEIISFVLNHRSLSTRCRSRYEADLSVSVVSFISRSMK